MQKRALGLALGFLVVSLFACGSDDGEDAGESTPPAPCNELAGECPAGQVCWPNAEQTAFECLNAAAGIGKGSSCVNTLGFPSCDEGLACVMLQGQTSGTCMPYCDPAIEGKGCGAGETCMKFLLPGVGSAYVCMGSTPPPDAGAPQDAGTEQETGSVQDAEPTSDGG